MVTDKVMETATLTKKQQKAALSGKKQSQKSLRNVLALPYDTYWPLVHQEEEIELCSILESVLPPARHPSQSIPWAELQKIPREQRRERRALQLQAPTQSKELRQSLLLGVNSVTRALEKGVASCVLLAQDVDPPVLTRHIVTLCSLHKVPLLVLPTLRNVTSTSLGFPCIALGLKKCVAILEDNHFHGLYQKISKLSAAFPWVEPATIFHDSSSDDEDGDKPSKPVPQPSVDLYKYRTSSKERAFIPSGGASEPAPQADFLSLRESGTGITSDDESIPEMHTLPVRGISNKWCLPLVGTRKERRAQYKTPVIKRIRPNPDKVKRKNKFNKTKK